MLMHIDTIFRAISVDAALDDYVLAAFEDDNLSGRPVIEVKMLGGLKCRLLKFVLPSFWVRCILKRKLKARFNLNPAMIEDCFTQPVLGSGFDFKLKDNIVTPCTGENLLRKHSLSLSWNALQFGCLVVAVVITPLMIWELQTRAVFSWVLSSSLCLINFGWPGWRLKAVETKKSS